MPDTIRRWHRKLVRSKWHYRHRVVSREWIPDHVRLLVWRLASENPTWGYCRLRGELKKVRAEMSTTSIRRILAEMHRPPPRRETWRQFIRAQASSIIAVHLPHGVIDQPLTLVFAAGRGVLEILNLQLTRRGVVQGASAGRGPSRSVQCAT
jgi:hypothetical protein